MDTGSGNNRLVATIILLSALSIYILLDLAIAVSLILTISSSFALLTLTLLLYILGPLPIKQKILLSSLIITAVFSMRFVDWGDRKSFLRDFNQIQRGMKVEEVDAILADYNKFVSRFANQSLQGDIHTGTIIYLPINQTREDSHMLSFTFAGGRVIGMTFNSN